MFWKKWLTQMKWRQLKISKPDINGHKKLLIKKYRKNTDTIYKDIINSKVIKDISIKKYAEYTKKTCNDVYKNVYTFNYKIMREGEKRNKNNPLKSDEITKNINDKFRNLKLGGFENLKHAILIRDLFHGNIGKFVLRAVALKILSSHSLNMEALRNTINVILQKHNIIKENITAEQFREYISLILFFCQLPDNIEYEFKDSENITTNNNLSDNTEFEFKYKDKVSLNDQFADNTVYDLKDSENILDGQLVDNTADKNNNPENLSSNDDYGAVDITAINNNHNQPNEHYCKKLSKNDTGTTKNIEFPYNITSNIDSKADMDHHGQSDKYEFEIQNKDNETDNTEDKYNNPQNLSSNDDYEAVGINAINNNHHQPDEHYCKELSKNDTGTTKNNEFPYNIRSTIDNKADRDYHGQSDEYEFKKQNKNIETANNFVNIKQYSIFFGVRFAPLIMKYCVKIIFGRILSKANDTPSLKANDIKFLNKFLLIIRILIIIFFFL